MTVCRMIIMFFCPFLVIFTSGTCGESAQSKKSSSIIYNSSKFASKKKHGVGIPTGSYIFKGKGLTGDASIGSKFKVVHGSRFIIKIDNNHTHQYANPNATHKFIENDGVDAWIYSIETVKKSSPGIQGNPYILYARYLINRETGLVKRYGPNISTTSIKMVKGKEPKEDFIQRT